ncbi:MAG TPA: hypothetical protein VK204_06660 [Nocardioidaceae bacterium]|nr:hypothetical protein [Nocardioidaceae bacterium]
MSRTAHNAALGLASLGLLGGSLIAAGPAVADHTRSDSGKEVDGKTCLESRHDKECKSTTTLEADERSRGDDRNRSDDRNRRDDRSSYQKSDWKTVKLSADVDFFQKKSDDRDRRDDRNRSNDNSRYGDNNSRDGYSKSDRDLGEVDFQYWDTRRHDWKTFATEDVDKHGEADVTVKIKVRHHDEVKVRADYSGVRDQIKGSTSDTVEIG